MGATISNARGIVQLPRPATGLYDASGAPVMSLRRLHLSDFGTSAGGSGVQDPNSRLASAITDGGEGTGISCALTGGLAALTDPFDGAYATAPISSIFGTKLAGSGLMWQLVIHIVERTYAGNTTEYNFAAGICNEATDSGTIDALLSGFRGVTNRTVQAQSIANGTASSSTGNVTASRSLLTTFQKSASGSTGRITLCCASMDAALASVSNTAAPTTATSSVASFGDVEPRIVLAWWRTTTIAGTATGAYDVYTGLGASFRVAS